MRGYMSRSDILLDELLKRYPVLEKCREDIWTAFKMMCSSYESDGKLLIAGNGGSASDANHMVGELMKGFLKQRSPDDEQRRRLMETDAELGKELCSKLQLALPAIAMTEHVSLNTAYLNDVDGILGFAQQVYGYGKQGDIMLGITTSGNSRNILYAAVAARAKGLKVIALTGMTGGRLKRYADVTIAVPETEAYKIQELHLPVYHALCLMLEEYFFD